MAVKDSYERVPPKELRKVMANWAVDAWKKTNEDVVYNSWRHDPFSYFPDEETRETAYESDIDGDDDDSYTTDEEADALGDEEIEALSI